MPEARWRADPAVQRMIEGSALILLARRPAFCAVTRARIQR